MHIGLDAPAIGGTIKPTGFPLPTEAGFFHSFRIVGGDSIPIQEGSLARIAFLLQYDLDSDELCLVGEHFDEFGMGNLNKLLVVFVPQFHLLLPIRIFAHDQSSDPFFDQQIDDPTACRVQIRSYPAIALRRDSIKLAGSEPLGFAQMAKISGALLVVVLV